MRRKSFLIVAVLLIASLVLGACAQATEAPTEAPEETEAPTEEPTEVPEEPVSLNPYIGSNKLDGNGVPPTFFDDVHIRRGFACV